VRDSRVPLGTIVNRFPFWSLRTGLDSCRRAVDGIGKSSLEGEQSWALVTHACNPSRDQEDRGSEASPGK
jgi:hypothetical protein